MFEMKTSLKKIKPEENCYRYYEMVLRKAADGYLIEMGWGRLSKGNPPERLKRKVEKMPNRQLGIKRLLDKLNEKERKGYFLS